MSKTQSENPAKDIQAIEAALRDGRTVGIDPMTLCIVGASKRDDDLKGPNDTDAANYAEDPLWDSGALDFIPPHMVRSFSANPQPVTLADGEESESGVFTPVGVEIRDDGTIAVVRGRNRTLALRAHNRNGSAYQVVPCALSTGGEREVATENIGRKSLDTFGRLMGAVRHYEQGTRKGTDMATAMHCSEPQAGKYLRFAKWYSKHVKESPLLVEQIVDSFKDKSELTKDGDVNVVGVGIPLNALTSKFEGTKTYVFGEKTDLTETQTWVKAWSPKKKGKPVEANKDLTEKMRDCFKSRAFNDLVQVQGVFAEDDEAKDLAVSFRKLIMNRVNSACAFWDITWFGGMNKDKTPKANYEDYAQPFGETKSTDEYVCLKACYAFVSGKGLQDAKDRIKAELQAEIDADKKQLKAAKDAVKDAEKLAKQAAKEAAKLAKLTEQAAE